MYSHFKRSIVAIALLSISPAALAVPLDLSGWSPLTLDYDGGQPAGSWVLGGGNTEVTQVINADPSFYLNGLNQTDYSMDGSWQVLPGGNSDDDFMGFVFGYQNSSNFYLFDWKQGSQSYVGGTANEGMTIRKMTGGTGDGLADLSLLEFWHNSGNIGDSTVLDSNHSGTAGWADNVLYDFHLDFNTIPGQFTIVVKQGATELWNTTVVDAAFGSGQFGFYNFSQEDVRYAGFVQEGGVIVDVPEPAALALLGFGLAGMGVARRRRSKK